MLKLAKKNSPPAEADMSFLDHLEELRWHVIKALLAIIAVAILAMIFKTIVFDYIIFAPIKEWFPIYNVFPGRISPPDFKIVPREVGEVFFEHIKVSFFLGLIIAFPYVFSQFWQFIKPGLYEKEQKAARGTVFVCSLLFIIGVLFGFFIITPFAYTFLLGYNVGIEVENGSSLSSYVTYLVMFTIPTGLIFEMPVVVYFLARVGLVTAATMRAYRKHALIGILVLAAVMTPPDVLTQFLIGVPMYILYEISIHIARRAEKKYNEV